MVSVVTEVLLLSEKVSDPEISPSHSFQTNIFTAQTATIMGATKTLDTITADELSKHNARTDLWVAVNGRVYDLTNFAEDHPGGINVLEECAGTDASEPFEYAGHTADAVKTMQQFLVGRTEKGGDMESSDTNVLSGTPALMPALRKMNDNGEEKEKFRNMAYMATVVGVLGVYWGLRSYGASSGERKVGVRGVNGTVEFVKRDIRGMDGAVVGLYATILVLILGGLGGSAFLYNEFIKTLKRREVFEYPAVIPRRSRKI